LVLLGPAYAQAAGGTVEGIVTPLVWAQEVEVCVVESRPSETCIAPAADGPYALHEVPFGGARIEFVPSFRSRLLTQYYDGVGKLSEAKNVVLSALAPTAKEIDADLVEGGAITGTVTAAADGEPLPGVEVCAISSGSSTAESCAETVANGDYELHSLPGGAYRVVFWGAGTSAEYEPWSHSIVAVTAGETITGIDAGLARGGKIKGTVTAAAGGARLADIAVCLFAATSPKPQRCTYSDEAGEYSFAGLQDGPYQVGFSLTDAEIDGEGPAGEADGFETQYYDGVGARAQAVTISLLSPEVIGNVNATLFTPPGPAPPTPAPFVSSPIVPAAATIAEPKPRAVGCKKPKRKKKVKGKVRCVKPAKQKKKKHTKHKHQKGPHREGGKKR
jgi:hypothetical protein